MDPRRSGHVLAQAFKRNVVIIHYCIENTISVRTGAKSRPVCAYIRAIIVLVNITNTFEVGPERSTNHGPERYGPERPNTSRIYTTCPAFCKLLTTPSRIGSKL